MSDNTQAEIVAFQRKAAELAGRHPEIQTAVSRIEARGHDAHRIVSAELIRANKPEVLHWLGSQEGKEDADSLHNVRNDEGRTRQELQRISEKLERQGYLQDLQGYEAPESETDRYLRSRGWL